MATKPCLVCGNARTPAQAQRGPLCGGEACRRQYFTAPPPGCLVCGTPITRDRALHLPLCHREACRWRYEIQPPTRLCTICGRPLPLGSGGRAFCGDPACQRRFDRQERERVAQRLEAARALRRQGEEYRERAGGALGIAAPARFPLALVPSFHYPLVPLPEERRAALRAHLVQAVAEFLGPDGPPELDPDPPPPPPPALAALLGQGCATCRGYCCAGGGDRGYLTAVTIHRVLRARPDLTPDALIEVYLSHLGAEAIEGSCVFHQANGCALPRDLRADICNQFLCLELGQFCDSLRGGEPERAFFAAVEGRTIVHAAFAEGDRLLQAPPP